MTPGADAFTAEQVTRMLPLLRRIVMDIKGCATLVGRHQRAIEKLEAEASVDGPGPSEDLFAEHREKITALRARSEECRLELEELGGRLDCAEKGIVKFPARRADRPVFLTWKLGESRVAFWHPADSGHEDRRPLDDDEKMAEARNR